ncbi:hypothetical protein [Streptomyces sp. AB3(2024)]|uniref:hypothetical protein n=1 Tax=Streptomyces sp. AB3(2024) TaxID=3317321 RepID=UPI0035A34EA9
MNKWVAVAGVTTLGMLAVGCGASGETAPSGGGKPAAAGSPDAASPSLPKQADGELAADKGTRYPRVGLPVMEQLTCDKGDGGFRFGNGKDVRLSGTDDLPLREDKSGGDRISCFGFPRIQLSKGPITVTAPDLIARTKLFDKVADPKATLDKVFEESLGAGKGERPLVGEPTAVSTPAAVIKCQQNVADSFPMTTCYWADYGAVGAIDYFPPGGKHFSMVQAVERTKEFVKTALQPAAGS